MTDEKQVFWANDSLAGVTNTLHSFIGSTIRNTTFGGFTVSFGQHMNPTQEEGETAAAGFDTLAEARRFLEKVAVRRGFRIVSRRVGMNLLVASEKAQ